MPKPKGKGGQKAEDVALTPADLVMKNCNDQAVNVITSDGKVIIGTLKGMDKGTNIILDDSHERVFSTDQGVEKHPLGLCVIRGENVALIGEVDRETDQQLDLNECKARPPKPVVH